MILIEKIIKEAIEKDASDIHLINGMKPILRITRALVELEDIEPLDENALYDIYDYILRGNLERNEEYIQNKKVFSPQNWIKQKGSLKGVREAINSTLSMLKIVPQGKETYDKLKIGLQVDSASFEDRWTAE